MPLFVLKPCLIWEQDAYLLAHSKGDKNNLRKEKKTHAEAQMTKGWIWRWALGIPKFLYQRYLNTIFSLLHAWWPKNKKNYGVLVSSLQIIYWHILCGNITMGDYMATSLLDRLQIFVIDKTQDYFIVKTKYTVFCSICLPFSRNFNNSVTI